jgi:hypothetical protein
MLRVSTRAYEKADSKAYIVAIASVAVSELASFKTDERGHHQARVVLQNRFDSRDRGLSHLVMQ